MDALDEIPWGELTHAYGPADDVPDLLRALRTALPDFQGEESPLWQLFGSIWHQGTVYEATSYAVPFLIELALDPQTPDRVGILSLLAEIAQGSSYRDVHGNYLLNEADFERKRAEELVWVGRAHDAVAAGFAPFVELTHEPGEVRYAAAAVLSRLAIHRVKVGTVLRRLLNCESRVSYRAGLLLLIGAAGDLSEETRAVLQDSVNSAEEQERHAAAFAISRLRIRPLPVGAREAIMGAILAEDLEAELQDLYWIAAERMELTQLFSSLDVADRDRVADELIGSVERGEATSQRVDTLVKLLFPPTPRGCTRPVTTASMTPLQQRAVRALFQAMKGGNRIFYGHFPSWGLPDTMREWRELASGQDPTPVNLSRPVLADPHHPDLPLAPGKLAVGQCVLHRHFGLGTVVEIVVEEEITELTVDFDEEGITELSLPTDGKS